MTKKRIAKIAVPFVALALVFSFSAPAKAVTVAELQAQINLLMAQLAALQGGTVTTTTTFTQNLTVGSTGSQVVALQQMLVAEGHLVMPAGVAYGYFGPLTKSAVAKYQAAHGISPAVGYFGPITRAHVNANASGTTTGGTVTGGTTTGGTINTPGVEGTLTATLYPTPASGTKLYEGDDMKKVLGVELEAKLSDVRVERVKVQIPSITYYREIAGKIYVMDGSTVVASSDLNSSTVVKEGSNYYITLTGIDHIVRKDQKKVLTIAVDAKSSIDSNYTDGDTFTLTIPENGVRGVDGAGINLYAPSSAISRSHTPTASLIENATLTLSTSASTPSDMEKICTSGADEDECDDLELLKIDLRAEKDAVTVTDLVVNVSKTGAGTASSTVATLYDGSTVVGSATIANQGGANSVTFSDIDLTVAEDSTKTLTFKIDVTNTNASPSIYTASSTASNVTAENSISTAITATGSATGESITLRNQGLEYTLVSKSISKDTGGSYSGATSSLQANFKVKITARGAAVEFGNTASTTYAFADNDSTGTAAPSFIIYRGGTAVTPAVSSSTTMVLSSSLASAGSNSYSLPENNSVDVDLTYVMQGKDSSGANVAFGAYAVGLERLNWLTLSGGLQSSTFMAGESAWRTGAVTMP